MLAANRTNGDAYSHYPKNVGIVAMEVYFPKKCIDQVDLEKFDSVAAGKYTIGLGQTKMAFCDDREDINSICLTVVQNLLENYNIAPESIGRLEVGTETIIDKSKSVKSVLMSLFQESGNTSIEGIDTTNACYGGTNALFNSLQWIESSAWDGRYALVIAGDIAVYAKGPARPTGGAGVIAMLLGKDAPIIVDRGLRSTHMENAWDFYKPDLSSEYPEVDGPLTISCYFRAVDTCYQRYLERIENQTQQAQSLDTLDYFVFHSPFTKLVQKSFARLAFNDFLRNPTNPAYSHLLQFKSLTLEETYFNRDVEKAFMEFTKSSFQQKVGPSLLLAKQLGNMYCGSVYACFASALNEIPAQELLGKRLMMFSYGSGFAASMFSFTVRADISHIVSNLDLQARLAARNVVAPEVLDETMRLREETHNLRNYEPVSSTSSENLWPGTFYLSKVDEKFRRTYERSAKEISL